MLGRCGGSGVVVWSANTPMSGLGGKMFDLQGAVVVVTGASSGLGRRFALDLAAAGAVVTGLARREAMLAAVAEEMRRTSPSSATIVCDVSDTDRNSPGLAGIERGYGRTDELRKNPGSGE